MWSNILTHRCTSKTHEKEWSIIIEYCYIPNYFKITLDINFQTQPTRRAGVLCEGLAIINMETSGWYCSGVLSVSFMIWLFLAWQYYLFHVKVVLPSHVVAHIKLFYVHPAIHFVCHMVCMLMLCPVMFNCSVLPLWIKFILSHIWLLYHTKKTKQLCLLLFVCMFYCCFCLKYVNNGVLTMNSYL